VPGCSAAPKGPATLPTLRLGAANSLCSSLFQGANQGFTFGGQLPAVEPIFLWIRPPLDPALLFQNRHRGREDTAGTTDFVVIDGAVSGIFRDLPDQVTLPQQPQEAALRNSQRKHTFIVCRSTRDRARRRKGPASALLPSQGNFRFARRPGGIRKRRRRVPHPDRPPRTLGIG
jgi:hypothetical protein